MKLSIIIPVYNVKDYLSQCLSSVLDQDLDSSEYEVIIVNDGSTDESLGIADNFADRYNNIRIVSQMNQGLSAARNSGLNIAKGDYVWFVDSDDFIEKRCLKEIVDTLYNHQLDGLRIRPVLYKGGDYVYDKRKLLSGIVTGKDGLNDKDSYRVTVWLTIYKRSVLIDNNLRFKVGIIHEDNEFTPRAYYYLKRFEFLDKHLYYYRVNPKSLTTDSRLLQKRSMDLIDIALSLKVFCETKVCDDFKPTFNRDIALVMNIAMDNADKIDKKGRKAFVDKVVNKKILIQSYIDSKDLMLRAEGVMLLLFPSYCLRIYSFLKCARNCLFNHKTKTSYIQ